MTATSVGVTRRQLSRSPQKPQRPERLVEEGFLIIATMLSDLNLSSPTEPSVVEDAAEKAGDPVVDREDVCIGADVVDGADGADGMEVEKKAGVTEDATGVKADVVAKEDVVVSKEDPAVVKDRTVTAFDLLADKGILERGQMLLNRR